MYLIVNTTTNEFHISTLATLGANEIVIDNYDFSLIDLTDITNYRVNELQTGLELIPLTLEEVKASKLQELLTAFTTDCNLPVTVGTKTYNGGKASALAIRDYIQLVTDSGGTVYTLWDIDNITADYTLEEAKTIMLAVASQVSQAEFNMNAKKVALNNATTVAEVEAITW